MTDYAHSFFLAKLAEILDVPPAPTAHFPFANRQQSWKYKHSGDKLVLRNGESLYTFKLPEDYADKDNFPIDRVQDNPLADDKNSKERTAQIHRSHPGEIYLTLQEGYDNPTYLFKQQDGTKWKATKKPKAKKKINDFAQEMTAFQPTPEVTKQADVYDAGRGALSLVDKYGKMPISAAVGGTLAHQFGLNVLRGTGLDHVLSPSVTTGLDYGLGATGALTAALLSRNLLLPTALAKFTAGA